MGEKLSGICTKEKELRINICFENVDWRTFTLKLRRLYKDNIKVNVIEMVWKKCELLALAQVSVVGAFFGCNMAVLLFLNSQNCVTTKFSVPSVL
jgi:hypothetical protein